MAFYAPAFRSEVIIGISAFLAISIFSTSLNPIFPNFFNFDRVLAIHLSLRIFASTQRQADRICSLMEMAAWQSLAK